MLGKTVAVRKSWVAYLVGFIAQVVLYIGGTFLLTFLYTNELITGGEGLRFVFVGGIGMGYTVVFALIGVPAVIAMLIGRFQWFAAIYVMILGIVLVILLVPESLLFVVFPLGLFASAYFAWTESQLPR